MGGRGQFYSPSRTELTKNKKIFFVTGKVPGKVFCEVCVKASNKLLDQSLRLAASMGSWHISLKITQCCIFLAGKFLEYHIIFNKTFIKSGFCLLLHALYINFKGTVTRCWDYCNFLSAFHRLSLYCNNLMRKTPNFT